MRKVAVKHPLVSSVIVILLFEIASFLGGLLVNYSSPFFSTNGEFLINMIGESVICLCGILVVWIFGYGKIWNQTENFGKGLFCGGIFIIYPLFSAFSVLLYEFIERRSGFFKQMLPAWKIAVFVITMFLIGFAEETFFRGTVGSLFWDKHAKDPAGVWTAVVYSGLVFGLVHFGNLAVFLDPSVDRDLALNGIVGVIVQMVGASALGMCLTAVYYRSKNIWAVICLHGFYDMCGLISEGLFGGNIASAISTYQPIMVLTTSLPFIITTLIILRKKKMLEMLSAEGAEIKYYPGPKGKPIPEIDSSISSRRSRDRIIIIALIIGFVLFFTSIVINGYASGGFDMLMSSSISSDAVLNVSHSGDWEGEQVFGHQVLFEVDKSGNYQVTVRSLPTDPEAYVFVQINDSDGEAVFEANYGGKCSDIFSLGFEAGEYELNLIYDYERVSDKSAKYDTRVVIQ